jgi:hypothetical protein
MLTRSEHARFARAELEAIIAALRVHELAQLVALGRKLLDQDQAAGNAVGSPCRDVQCEPR